MPTGDYFRYLYPIKTTLEPWRLALEPAYEQVVNLLQLRDQSLEDWALRHNGLWTPGPTFPDNPQHGDLFYETDTDVLWAYNGTAWVQMIDSGEWTSWTPQLWQNANLTSTNNRSVYTRLGRTIHLVAYLSNFQAGSAVSEIQLRDLPIACHGSGAYAGVFRYFDAGNTIYTGTCLINSVSSTILNFYVSGNGNAMGVNPSFATAAADNMQVGITYEAAAST